MSRAFIGLPLWRAGYPRGWFLKQHKQKSTKMNKIVNYFGIFLYLIGSSSAAAMDGDELFNNLCSSCHTAQGAPVSAPPIFAVINHVKSAYPDREEFVQRIVDWVREPKAEDALMPGALRRFGVMPKLPYSEKDVRKVAEYLYDSKIQLPEWYKEHFKQEHGYAPKQ